MEVITVDPRRPTREPLERAGAVLESGGIVAFPTETVYGLAVRADNRTAVERLYRLKGRAAAKAAALLVSSRRAAERHAKGGELEPLAARLADTFWPGPLTLVVPGAKRKLIGLRLSSLPLARALAKAARGSLYQTSANLSERPPAQDARTIVEALPQIDLVLDGGKTPGGASSTVVKCESGHFTVLRPGAIPPIAVARAASRLVLFVCTGNLCRSPLAEAMWREGLAERLGCRPVEVVRFGHRVASFGTMAIEDNPAPDNTVAVGKEYGLDLTPHRARPFSIALIEHATKVFALAPEHADFLRPYFDKRENGLELLDPDGKIVPDPYGRTLRAYRKAAAQIYAAVEDRLDTWLDEEAGSGLELE